MPTGVYPRKPEMFDYRRGKPPWNRGIPLSEEQRLLISAKLKGRHSSVRTEFKKGFRMSQATKDKISNANKGRRHSETHNKRVADANRGRKFTLGQIEKMRQSHLGKKFSEEQKRKIGDAQRGARSHWWKGGITPINKIIRMSAKYKAWRIAVFMRDDYTCTMCGTRGCILNADHIKPFAWFPELRFELDNGRTLCVPCHKKTASFLNRWYKPGGIEEKIDKQIGRAIKRLGER